MKRRTILRTFCSIPFIAGLFRPLTALAEWNVDAFSAESEQEALEVFFPGENIQSSDKIEIIVHETVENGAVVPVQIDAQLGEVSAISILVENNPNPLIAHFDLDTSCLGFVATRIKMDVSSDVVAVVRSNGSLYSHRQYVEVLEGGCA